MNKLLELKRRLEITDDSKDVLLSSLLSSARNEILAYRYSFVGIPKYVVDVPAEYNEVQIEACITAFNLMGAENQTRHDENGISRVFKFSDIVDYVRSKVCPIIGLGLPHITVQDTLELQAGSSAEVEILNAEGDVESVSADPSIATVSGVLVTAVKEGETYIEFSDDKHKVIMRVVVS